MDKAVNRKKEQGVATILVIGVLLFFILFFFVVAIDFAFVYTARGQLQNAADAAALAGADLITPNQYDHVQTLARNEAIQFAQDNYVTGQPVSLLDEDIEFGHWDDATATFDPAGSVNAIKVSAKRLASRDNAVSLFFGGIVGWPTMDILRVAIASKPARANVPIVVCIDACDPPLAGGVIINSSGTKFYLTPPYGSDITNSSIQQVAWTEYSSASNVTPAGEAAFFCGSVFDSCDESIDTNNGAQDITLRQFRCAFLNPLYDSSHKTCENSLGTPKPCDLISDTVNTWRVLSPLTNTCPPSDQGGNVEPYDITGYAEISITDVFASGPATSSSSANNCACKALGPENFTESSLSEKVVIINGIHCVDCSDDTGLEGLRGRKPFLVK